MNSDLGDPSARPEPSEVQSLSPASRLEVQAVCLNAAPISVIPKSGRHEERRSLRVSSIRLVFGVLTYELPLIELSLEELASAYR
jgi:hypothetical protein